MYYSITVVSRRMIELTGWSYMIALSSWMWSGVSGRRQLGGRLRGDGCAEITAMS